MLSEDLEKGGPPSSLSWADECGTGRRDEEVGIRGSFTLGSGRRGALRWWVDVKGGRE